MWLKQMAEWRAQGIPCALVTITESEGSTPRKTGSNMAVSGSGEIAGSVGGGAVEHFCIALAKEAIGKETCITRRFLSKGDGDDWKPTDEEHALGVCGGALTVFIEPVVPEPELVIFGGGHVGLYLARLCEVLEIPCRMYDDRPEFADAGRFPKARDVICAPFTEIAGHISLSGSSYCVIMTYGHQYDQIVLEQLLREKSLPYIGMIGSPAKAGVLIRNIQKKGEVIDNRLYCPIGLRIGRNLPQEIALSVLSEITLLMRGGKLEHMRLNWADAQSPAGS
jgi:xanthine dehydrogenase accessory factor